MRSPKLLITYSWDSSALIARALGLANRLRAEGIECQIDQYISEPSGPREGWPLWWQRQLRDAEFVAVICPGAYVPRICSRLEPWLHAPGARNQVISLLWQESDRASIPAALQEHPVFCLTNDAAYEALYRHLTLQPAMGSMPARFFELPPREPREAHFQPSSGILPWLLNRPRSDTYGDLKPIAGVLPQLPNDLLPRTTVFQAAKSALLTQSRRVVALVGDKSGLGKTVLAAQLAQDEDIRGFFPDGVYWLNLGPGRISLVDIQHQMAQALTGGSRQPFAEAQTGKAYLEHRLCEKKALVILDDVQKNWQITHWAEVLEPNRVLLTVRSAETLGSLPADILTVPVLDPEQARTLLATRTHRGVAQLPAIADAILAACGYLPLAITLVGAVLAELPDAAWPNAFAQVCQSDLRKLEFAFHAYPHPELLQVIHACVGRLEAQEQAWFLELAVFPPGAPIPEKVLELFWETKALDGARARELVERLITRGLLLTDAQANLRLSAPVRQYLDLQTRLQDEDPHLRHNRLLGAYLKACKTHHWSSGPRDGYFFQWLPWHLQQAGRQTELQLLLFDFHWLQAKLEVLDTYALAQDYADFSATEESGILQTVLAQAAPALAGNPKQFSCQILARLLPLEVPALSKLKIDIGNHLDYAWLWPKKTNLAHSGSADPQSAHHGPVLALAVTSDGKWAFSGSEDRSIKVWDLKAGKEKQILKGHTGAVLALAVTPDGKQIVSGSEDKLIYLWDLKLGKATQTLTGNPDAILALAVTPDGRQILTGSWEYAPRIWELRDGEVKKMCRGSSRGLLAAAITPDGKRVISGGMDNTLQIWDLQRGLEKQTLCGHDGWVQAVAVTADGKTAVSASRDSSLKVWDLASGKQTCTLTGHGGWVNALALSADGNLAVSVSIDHTLKVWDLVNGLEKRTIDGHTGWVNAVALTPDGTFAFSGAMDNTLRVWELRTGREVRSLAGHTGFVSALTVTQDGRLLISASEDRTLKVWDWRNGRCQATLTGHDGLINSVAVTPDGRYAVSGSEDRTVGFWDLKQAKALSARLGHTDSVSGVAVTPDGTQAVSASLDGSVQVWNILGEQDPYPLRRRPDGCLAIAVTPDGTQAVSGSANHTLRVWDLTACKDTQTMRGHDDWVTAVAVTPDGRLALSAGRDHTLKVWELAGGAEKYTLRGHTDRVNAVAITPDGRLAVSAADDKTIKVWNLESGECVAEMTGAYPFRACACSPQDDLVLAGDESGFVHILKLVGV